VEDHRRSREGKVRRGEAPGARTLR
jgi:hypothetical protein